MAPHRRVAVRRGQAGANGALLLFAVAREAALRSWHSLVTRLPGRGSTARWRGWWSELRPGNKVELLLFQHAEGAVKGEVEVRVTGVEAVELGFLLGV